MSKKVATVIFHEDEDEDEDIDQQSLQLLETIKDMCREYLDTLTGESITEKNVKVVLGAILLGYPMQSISFLEKAGLLAEDEDEDEDEDDEEDEE